MSEPRWHYAVSGRQHGPVSDSVLKELLRRGEVKQSDLVWRDGLPAWVAASRLRRASGSGADGGVERTSSAADEPRPPDASSGPARSVEAVPVVPPAGAQHLGPGARKVPSTAWIRVASFTAVWGLSIPVLAAGWVTPSWCIGTVSMSAVIAIVSAVWAASESVRIRLRDHRSALAFEPIVVGILVAVFWPVTFPWFIGERRRAALGALPSAADGRSPHWFVVAARLVLYLICYFLLTLFVAVAFSACVGAG